jgi:hypothetical protein
MRISWFARKKHHTPTVSLPVTVILPVSCARVILARKFDATLSKNRWLRHSFRIKKRRLRHGATDAVQEMTSPQEPPVRGRYAAVFRRAQPKSAIQERNPRAHPKSTIKERNETPKP